MKKPHCALVLGGYVNGYDIVSELFEKGVEDIVLFDVSRKIASYSSKITKFVLVEKSKEALLDALKALHEEYELIIAYPTDDTQLEHLHALKEEVGGYCFLPLNKGLLPEQLDKHWQYSVCEKLGVPYPKTVLMENAAGIDRIKSLRFPVIIKPVKREDIKTDIFRNLQVKDELELEEKRLVLEGHLAKNLVFMASEIVPGDGSNIYAYVCYRNEQGEILNEWTGKKLSQYPDDFGVFASASNKAPEIVREQGRRLVEGMDAVGICEPEFKYDARDDKYKLMEVNMRSMMWHRTGNLSGVNLQYSQYLDALGEKVERQTQDKERDVHYVYLKHELSNLFFRKGYLRVFHANLFKSDKTYLTVFDLNDVEPFIIVIIDAIKILVGTCLKALRTGRFFALRR